jgi:hypothetical protein
MFKGLRNLKKGASIPVLKRAIKNYIDTQIENRKLKKTVYQGGESAYDIMVEHRAFMREMDAAREKRGFGASLDSSLRSTPLRSVQE